MTAHTAEQLQGAALQGLPRGWAINRAPDGYIGRLTLALADEPSRLENRIDDLMNELDPRTALEMLPEWERRVGLPDPCTGPPASIDIARAQVMARLDPSLRGQSIPVLTALAANFGYAITIEETEPWTCDSSCDHEIADWDWGFVWFVHAAATVVFPWTCDSSCDDPLGWYGNSILECEIRRRAPPETAVFFTYGD